MRAAFTAQAVRAAEQAVLAGRPADSLQDAAAGALALRCAALLPAVYGSAVTLLIGSGDNGGDVALAGAALARRGAVVTAVLLSARTHPRGLAALRAAGVAVADAADGAAALAHADLVVDGLLGIGGRGGLREPAASLVAGAPPGPVWVAADLPSGVDADTGAVDGVAVQADVTVAFGALKPGLVLGAGRDHAGVVVEVDIGLGPHLGAAAVLVAQSDDVAAWWPWPRPDDDKYRRGVVAVDAGSPAYPGAGVLAVGGAVAAGAGMVRVLGPRADAVLSRFPECVVGEGRVQARVVGPGLGTGADAMARLARALDTDVPVVVDADGLTLLATDPGLVRARTALTVLTPHDREFERLGGPVGSDRAGAARRLADDLGAVVLLKGSATVVARPGQEQVYANPTGVADLATAGSGDVLSGVIGRLLAAGLGERAPVVAAYVHGVAGAHAAAIGPVAATDLLAGLRAAVAGLRGD